MTPSDAPPRALGTATRADLVSRAPARRPETAVLPLLLLELALWAALLAGGLFRAGPNGRSLGVDFAVFVSAAQVMAHGGNPYDNHLLFRTERAFLGRQGLAAPTQVGLVRAGNPPLFYWALEPLTRMPFRSAALSWIAAMFALAGLGFLACLNYLGWTKRTFPLLLFLLLPQVALGACYGNVYALVFAALSASLALLRRHPLLAGLLLASGWLKPQLVFPLVLLIVLFHPPYRRRLLAGFGVATGALLGLTMVALGWHSMELWFQGLTSWSHDIGLQPNMASLAGLYAGWAPYRLQMILTAFILALASAMTIRTWKVQGQALALPSVSAWLWVVWFLATPYAHFPDEILLTLPVLAMVGRDGRELGRKNALLAVYILFISLTLFSVTISHANLLSLTLLVVAVCLYQAHNQENAFVPRMTSNREVS